MSSAHRILEEFGEKTAQSPKSQTKQSLQWVNGSVWALGDGQCRARRQPGSSVTGGAASGPREVTVKGPFVPPAHMHDHC